MYIDLAENLDFLCFLCLRVAAAPYIIFPYEIFLRWKALSLTESFLFSELLTATPERNLTDYLLGVIVYSLLLPHRTVSETKTVGQVT